MKNSFLLFFLVVTTNVFSQNLNGVIYFNEGSTKSGFVSLGDDEVVLRPTKKSKEKTKFKSESVDKVELMDEGVVSTTFFFKQTKKGKSLKTLVVTRLWEGEVSLYLHYSSGMNSNHVGYETLRYYVARDEETLSKIFPTGIDKTSERTIKEYFHDCPRLGELIDKKAFQRVVDNNHKLKRNEKVPERLKEIVKYYNSNCSD